MQPRILGLTTLGLLLWAWAAAPVCWASPKEQAVENLVNQAVALIEKQGAPALDEFSQPNSRWFNDQAALFIFDEQGTELVNPTFPDLVGRNLWDLQDSTGRYPARLELELVKTQGGGWMDGRWARPQGGPEAKTRNYVKGARLGQRLLVVGSWYYVD